MTHFIDDRFRGRGTRFRLYPQSPVLADFRQTETVWLSPRAGTIGPGPSDRRMYTVQPVEKTPYTVDDTPPYRGALRPPAEPGPDGHFDHIRVEDPTFLSAHMYGAIRRVLDIWEGYAGGPLPWHFQATHARLELIPHLPWDNAQFGWGFCECGEAEDDAGVARPFALNFDVLAHEAGHGLVFSMAGLPTGAGLTTEFLAFHESASDLVSLVAALHFERFIDHVLEATEGDLHRENELNRIGELSPTRQIRRASNATKLGDLGYRDLKPKELTGHQLHELGQPLTGAFFDIGVEFFLRQLLHRGVVSAAEIPFELPAAGDPEALPVLSEAYARAPEGFRHAICDARDMLGLRLARSWHRIRPDGFGFGDATAAFLAVDRALSGTTFTQTIRACFDWRGLPIPE